MIVECRLRHHADDVEQCATAHDREMRVSQNTPHLHIKQGLIVETVRTRYYWVQAHGKNHCIALVTAEYHSISLLLRRSTCLGNLAHHCVGLVTNQPCDVTFSRLVSLSVEHQAIPPSKLPRICHVGPYKVVNVLQVSFLFSRQKPFTSLQTICRFIVGALLDILSPSRRVLSLCCSFFWCCIENLPPP